MDPDEEIRKIKNNITGLEEASKKINNALTKLQEVINNYNNHCYDSTTINCPYYSYYNDAFSEWASSLNEYKSALEEAASRVATCIRSQNELLSYWESQK